MVTNLIKVRHLNSFSILHATEVSTMCFKAQCFNGSFFKLAKYTVLNVPDNMGGYDG